MSTPHNTAENINCPPIAFQKPYRRVATFAQSITPSPLSKSFTPETLSEDVPHQPRSSSLSHTETPNSPHLSQRSTRTSRFSVASSRYSTRRTSFASSYTYSLRDSWRSSWHSYASTVVEETSNRNNSTAEPLSEAAEELRAKFSPLPELDLTLDIERKMSLPKPAVSEALRKLNAGGDWDDDDDDMIGSKKGPYTGSPTGSDVDLISELRRVRLPTEEDAARYRARSVNNTSSVQSSARHDSVDSIDSWMEERPATPPFRPPSVIPTLENANEISASDTVSEPSNEEEAIDESLANLDTKSIFTDRQKLAYVGLCYLILSYKYTGKEAVGMETKAFWASAMNFSRNTLRKLYQHMNITPAGELAR
jgi:hypothetical protein